MSAAQPLIGFETQDALGWRHGEAIAAGRFCAAAVELAARMPRTRRVINLCEDRLNFALGLVAALVNGSTSVLPPSRAAGIVRELAALHPDSCCLTDHGALPAGLPALMVPPWPDGSISPAELPAIADDLQAVVLFTSGSTGRPQPHAKSWHSLRTAARALASHLQIAPGQRRVILGTVPPQHMYGLETTIMLPLQSGMTIQAARPLLPADIAAALAATPPARWLATTPIHLRACLAEAAEFPALRGILSATMPLPSDLARAAETRWHAPVIEIYGCTEAGVVGLRRTALDERWCATTGLRFRQSGAATWISGEHLDAELQLPDQLLLTTTGEFTLAGRPTDMLKIAGKRASLEALNAELLLVAGVRDGAFFVPKTVRGEHRLAALVVAPGVTREKLLAALRERIDAAFLPRPLILVDALPRNAVGKLEREALIAFAHEALGRQRVV